MPKRFLNCRHVMRPAEHISSEKVTNETQPSKIPQVSDKQSMSIQTLEEQIERFLEFDTRDLDYEENHYGLWEERMFQLIQLEYDRALESVAIISKKISVFTDRFIEIDKVIQDPFGEKTALIIEEYDCDE
jgi:hypothetical protein